MELTTFQRRFHKPTTLAIEIARHLREAIIRGEFLPGERLNEARLTQQFGLSRSPLREAFRILEAEGLVTVQPRRGAYIRTLSDQDLLDIFDVRIVCETHALRQGRDRLTTDSLRDMSTALAEARTALARAAFEPWHQASLRFHNSIVALSGNNYLIRLYDELKISLRRYQIFLIGIPLQPLRSQRDHEAILSALKAGNTDLALERLIAHIKGLEQVLLQAIRELADQTQGTLPAEPASAQPGFAPTVGRQTPPPAMTSTSPC